MDFYKIDTVVSLTIILTILSVSVDSFLPQRTVTHLSKH
jgi:hypothetical protein